MKPLWRAFIHEFWVWSQMRQRCQNPSNKQFYNYGARGISVCSRWDRFANFMADMGPRPKGDYTIERIDNDGDYRPENCRWAVRVENATNKRLYRKNISGLTGVTWDKSQNYWVARMRVNGRLHYLGKFRSIEEAKAARIGAEGLRA